jgi:hypothetical protein
MTDITKTWEYEALCLRLPPEGHWAIEVETAKRRIEYSESELTKEISEEYRLGLHATIGKYKAILWANARITAQEKVVRAARDMKGRKSVRLMMALRALDAPPEGKEGR